MPKLFPVFARPRQQAGNGGGPVTVERLQYDLPEHAPVPRDVPGLIFADQTSLGQIEEDSAVGILGKDIVTMPSLVEVTSTQLTASYAVQLLHPEDYATVEALVEHVAPSVGDEVHVAVTLASYADHINSSSGWQNAQQVLGNTTQQAFIAASSSGLLGLNSNTSSGTLEIGFPTIGLDWLNLGSVVLYSFHSSSVSGVSLGGGAYNIDYQYNLDGAWVTYAPIRSANVGALERTYDLTTQVNGDWSKLSDFRLRGTGSVTSGTGLGMQRSVGWRYARLELSAQRTE